VAAEVGRVLVPRTERSTRNGKAVSYNLSIQN
jgi:hypothetical protein